MRKRRNIGIIVIVAILLVCIVAGGFTGNYFYNLALNPNADRTEVLSAPHNAIGAGDDTMEIKPQSILEWGDEISYTQQHIQSFDDLKLSGYVISQEKPAHRWVIIAHGYGMQGVYMASSAKRYYDQGYNILLPDARGHGESEGDYIGMGWHDRLDIAAWIDEIISWDAEAEIVLYGVSMGGATVMMTAGEDLPSNVKVIVEDCGYTSVDDEFAYQLKALFGLPRFPVINFASVVTRIRAGYSFGEASAVEQLKKAKVPILFIHGDEDTFVPYEMLEQVYAAAAGEKEMFTVPGAGHGGASQVAGEEYWKTVFDFIDKHME